MLESKANGYNACLLHSFATSVAGVMQEQDIHRLWQTKGNITAQVLCLSTVVACVLGLVGADHHSTTRVHGSSRLGLV